MSSEHKITYNKNVQFSMKISHCIKEDLYTGKRNTANTYRMFKISVAAKYVTLLIAVSHLDS